MSQATATFVSQAISVGFDPAKSASLKIAGLKGTIPVFLNPLTAVIAAAALRYAPPKSSAIWWMVTTTLPG